MGLRSGAVIGAASVLIACACLFMPRPTVAAVCANTPHSRPNRTGAGAASVPGATQNRRDTTAVAAAIVGTASMYNPCRANELSGSMEGGRETASGEPYDPADWTAAIRTDLRDRFGGVHFGKDYRPAYALVEGPGKRAIVRINDVGPLQPGRIIDLNEQTMRYFDPTLELGIIRRVKVTPLPGDGWTPGPLGGDG